MHVLVYVLGIVYVVACCCLLMRKRESSFDETLARVLPGNSVVVVMTVPAVSVLLVAGKAGTTELAAGIACTVGTVPGTPTGRTKAPQLHARMRPILLLPVGSTPHMFAVAVAHRTLPPNLRRVFN